MTSLLMSDDQLKIEINRLKHLVESKLITQEVADKATVKLLHPGVVTKEQPVEHDVSVIEVLFRRDGE